MSKVKANDQGRSGPIESIVFHLRQVCYCFGRRTIIGDHRYRMPSYQPGRVPYSVNAHESHLNDVIARHLRERQGAFIDVGVNVGQTLLKVLNADPQRRYIGFEPQLACCFNIERFLKMNDLKNATVLPLALADKDGVLSFYTGGIVDETASLIEKPGSVSYVQVRIGDNILDELNVDKVSIIKIDVEGAELQVMHGLKNTLQVKRPIVMFEVLPNYYGRETLVMHPPERCARNQASADAIFNFLSSVGYSIWQIDADSQEREIKHFDLDDRSNFISADFVARPR